MISNFSAALPEDLKTAVEKAASAWDSSDNTARLWRKDPTLWTNSGEEKWLGWLDVVDQQLSSLSRFKALAEEVREDAFTHVLLLGMGGSSLCPEVFSLTFGQQANGPKLLVLDSTDPVQIKSFRDQIDPAHTLFCVSSKSGTTLEPNIYMQYFYDETKKTVGENAGKHFIAVTDPGSKLEKAAGELGFRHVYHGLPSIGGRYSALSDFGMVPHSAAGLDTEKLLKQARQMIEACKKPVAENPGVHLGLILGTAAVKFNRDKVTLICSKSIHDLGAWLEQLLAESTGKAGKGLIPVDREPLAPPSLYGKDRIFAYIKYGKDDDADLENAVSAIEKSGQPVIRLKLDDLYGLGQAFFQWEIATAVAGSVLGIDAFNQPDVEASKVVTRDLTNEFERTGSLPAEKPILDQDGIKIFTDEANAEALRKTGAQSLGDITRAHLDRIKANDYFALLAYIPMFPGHEAKLQEIRKQVMDAKKVATVLGFGPRFLHSTGQAYKGGPNSGVFIQITCDEGQDLQVPGQKYTFGIVKAAQARGDFQVLADRHRRALRIHLGTDVGKGLDHLANLISAALAH
jgi:transaldolase / glucose-6-phosphate isomerase